MNSYSMLRTKTTQVKRYSSIAPFVPQKHACKGKTNVLKKSPLTAKCCVRLRFARTNRAGAIFALFRSVFLLPPFSAVWSCSFRFVPFRSCSWLALAFPAQKTPLHAAKIAPALRCAAHQQAFAPAAINQISSKKSFSGYHY